MSLHSIKNKNKIKLSELKDAELLKLILHFYDNQRYEEVIRLSDKINFKSPDQYWVHYLKGLSYSKLNNYDKAIKNLNLSLLIKPKSPVCYLELISNFPELINPVDFNELFKNSSSSSTKLFP